MASCNQGQALQTTAQMKFRNPVVWEDLPDIEVIRVGGVYYMSASSFAFSPGAPILRSENLVDWDYVGHSVPELPFVSQFWLDGRNQGAYGKGIWASTMRYRKSNGSFYWYGPLQGTDKTFVYTAKHPSDRWALLASIDKFYYDLGLLIDEDDTFYLAYGTKAIQVAKLSPDGKHEIESRVIYESEEYLEGARMYNIKGRYYIWLTKPYAGQFVLMSRSGPFGPYECRQVISDILSPIPGSGSPHQGALIDSASGGWYYMAFMDGYPGGRIPVLAPVTFDQEGWPEVEADYSESPGRWCLQYPHPTPESNHRRTSACFRRHLFNHNVLDHCWEWNHNPDNSKWSIRGGRLVLQTGTITNNLYLATNTLTHRVVGPKSMATFCLNVSGLQDGDRAGASLFRNESAYIGIHKEKGISRLVCVQDLVTAPRSVPVGFMNGRPVALDWETKSNGFVKEETTMAADRVWLRIKADVTPAFSHGYEKETRFAKFEFSFDGTYFVQLGPDLALTNEAVGFVGYRFAVCNWATATLGGQLSVDSCDIQAYDVNYE